MAQDKDKSEDSPTREEEPADERPANPWNDQDTYPRRICTYNPEHWP